MGGELIGPYNAMLRSPEIATAFLGAVGAVGQYSTLSNAVRQVIILAVGAAWQATYELYAHEKVAQQAGLSAAAIRALAAGQPPVELSAAESLAHELTQQVTTAHQLSPNLYQRGVEALGGKGLAELLALANLHLTVSNLFNKFEVLASPAT